MRIVLALGGNALLARGQALTAENQRQNIKKAAKSIAEIAKDNEIIVIHGNGPQVGMLMEQNAVYHEASPATTPYPMDVLGAETCGMVGYMLQQEIKNIDNALNIATIVTQTLISADDPAFSNPTKFVGPIYSQEEATSIMMKSDKIFKADGDKYRRVVPSPQPIDIVELDQVETLLKADNIVIACGGGGVPVEFKNNKYRGIECVIDKDLTAELIAEKLNAEMFIILTDGSVYKDFGKETQQEMKLATPNGLAQFTFPAGSMGPKIDAVCKFVNSNKGDAAIGSLFELNNIIAHQSGTLITKGEGIQYYS
ncbi:carbamate kinase [Photobacterium piscicola]|uniref:Carbamate kinase n=1 Tax=Photobacterium piscicola TaxID=1378299 RepID=A0ABU6LJC6_9GAMM|nr:carbamate kinase [Photobacterium piscicola]